MTDAQFLAALEQCVLPEAEFSHRGHVRAAYLYLRRGDFAEALTQLRRAIRNYARHLGKPERYHETITVAYLALIQQHICERGDGGGWPAFERDNPELFRPGLLLEFYPQQQLDTALARKVFLLPQALPARNQICA